MTKPRKTLLIFFLTILTLLVLTVAFISPLAKYALEKFDTKLIGREITVDWAYVNPFTGYCYFANVKIYEFQKDTVFISLKGLSANLAMSRLFSKTCEFSEVVLDNPKGLVFQNEKYFNFNDLISKFSPGKDSSAKKEVLHLNILNIKINNGEFFYHEVVTPINYSVKNVNIQSQGYRWDADSIPLSFSFSSGIGTGDIKGDFSVDIKNKDYRLSVLINDFDLNIVGQYIKDLSNYGNFRAHLDADFKTKGNLLDKEAVNSSGLIALKNFHFGKDSIEDFAAFDNLTVAIRQISPKQFIYRYDSISLIHPYFKYEKYDYLDNVQTMFGKNGSRVKEANGENARFNLVIEIADYLKVISKNLLRSNYRIDHLRIDKGVMVYEDYSLGEKFTMALNPLSLVADSVDKRHKTVNLHLLSGIKPYGKIGVDFSINPKDSSDFDLRYKVEKVPMALFNPYFLEYTAFPFDRGSLKVEGGWHVRNGLINSHNHLVIIDPRIGEKSRNKSTRWIPLRLLMFFVREGGNVIDYEVPIVGYLKNPRFKIKDVILDALENVFVKPATAPYRVEVRNVEADIEKSLSLSWEIRSFELVSKQENFLKRMAQFLEENPQAAITLNSQRYALKEREHILLYEAKKKFFLHQKVKSRASFNEQDSLVVSRMSIKDSLFLFYLNKVAPNPMLFTIQEKCAEIISNESVNLQLEILERERLKVFMKFFKENGTEHRVKVLPVMNILPYNGFSIYKLTYNGDFPEYLIKAYQKMSELNNETPRNRFKEERKKNRIF